MLAFDAIVDKLDESNLYFKLKFENPLMVSIGSQKDILVGVILSESFFCSQDSYLTVKKGTELRTVLPKMIAGEEVV